MPAGMIYIYDAVAAKTLSEGGGWLGKSGPLCRRWWDIYIYMMKQVALLPNFESQHTLQSH
jgi:hypothetical protein